MKVGTTFESVFDLGLMTSKNVTCPFCSQQRFLVPLLQVLRMSIKRMYQGLVLNLLLPKDGMVGIIMHLTQRHLTFISRILHRNNIEK